MRGQQDSCSRATEAGQESPSQRPSTRRSCHHLTILPENLPGQRPSTRRSCHPLSILPATLYQTFLSSPVHTAREPSWPATLYQTFLSSPVHTAREFSGHGLALSATSTPTDRLSPHDPCMTEVVLVASTDEHTHRVLLAVGDVSRCSTLFVSLLNV